MKITKKRLNALIEQSIAEVLQEVDIFDLVPFGRDSGRPNVYGFMWRPKLDSLAEVDFQKMKFHDFWDVILDRAVPGEGFRAIPPKKHKFDYMPTQHHYEIGGDYHDAIKKAHRNLRDPRSLEFILRNSFGERWEHMGENVKQEIREYVMDATRSDLPESKMAMTSAHKKNYYKHNPPSAHYKHNVGLFKEMLSRLLPMGYGFALGSRYNDSISLPEPERMPKRTPALTSDAVPRHFEDLFVDGGLGTAKDAELAWLKSEREMLVQMADEATDEAKKIRAELDKKMAPKSRWQLFKQYFPRMFMWLGAVGLAYGAADAIQNGGVMGFASFVGENILYAAPVIGPGLISYDLGKAFHPYQKIKGEPKPPRGVKPGMFTPMY